MRTAVAAAEPPRRGTTWASWNNGGVFGAGVMTVTKTSGTKERVLTAAEWETMRRGDQS